MADPGFLAVVVVIALVKLARAVLQARTVLAVERERQVTARLAIFRDAGRPRPGSSLSLAAEDPEPPGILEGTAPAPEENAR
jgi:hypothetical protein